MHKLAVSLSLALLGCGGTVNSEADARDAYLGIDPSIDRAISLGFAGFNSASSANITPQTASGAKTGTLTVSGQVDQGASANKGMRLQVALVNYSDDGRITYATRAAALPALGMQLKNIPAGTLSGTLAGTVDMTGAQTGPLTFDLTITGALQAGAANQVERKPGSTRIQGTATSPSGTYAVDVTR